MDGRQSTSLRCTSDTTDNLHRAVGRGVVLVLGLSSNTSKLLGRMFLFLLSPFNMIPDRHALSLPCHNLSSGA